MTSLVCLTDALGKESKQGVEVKCWSRLVVQPVFSIMIADVSTQTSYDPIRGQTFSCSACLKRYFFWMKVCCGACSAAPDTAPSLSL